MDGIVDQLCCLKYGFGCYDSGLVVFNGIDMFVQQGDDGLGDCQIISGYQSDDVFVWFFLDVQFFEGGDVVDVGIGVCICGKDQFVVEF